jgi:hypothetical protein
VSCALKGGHDLAHVCPFRAFSQPLDGWSTLMVTIPRFTESSLRGDFQHIGGSRFIPFGGNIDVFSLRGAPA